MPDFRLAEVVGSLSLATEISAGVAPEVASRAAILATALAERLGMSAEERQDVYYASILRYIGCSGFAHETAWYGGGDDIGLLRAMTPADAGSLPSVLSHIVHGAGNGTSHRIQSVARMLSDPGVPKRLATAHCDQAVRLALRLGASARVAETLGLTYERFDGKGGPTGARGEAIAVHARIMHVAYCYVLHASFGGRAQALDVVKARRAGELDPSIADAFLAHAGTLVDLVAGTSVWDAFLQAEPSPRRFVPAHGIAGVALAFAHFVDLKSPFTIGHSVGVAHLCEQALRASGATPEEQESARVVGLLHDLGRVSVPNGIWDKDAALSPIERERVEQHAYHSERILARTPALSSYARTVGAHHERIDGSGYFRGAAASAIDPLTRVLAAADVFRALREDRAYRAALSAEAAAEVLAAEAKAGRLDADAVSHVLSAAGQKAPRPERALPCGLTEREVEVLVLLARGLTNKQIGKRLFISPRTVGHHVAHVYEKTKVRTRAAAALFAAENELVEAK